MDLWMMQTMMLLGRSQAIATMSCPSVSTVGVCIGDVHGMVWRKSMLSGFGDVGLGDVQTYSFVV